MSKEEKLHKITIFREVDTSALAGFHTGLLSWSIELEFGCVGLYGEFFSREPGEKPSRQEPTTKSTHIWHAMGRNQSRATFIAGERSQHRVFLAPLKRQ